MTNPKSRRKSPRQTAREALWEHLNRHAGPFTYLMRIANAEMPRVGLQSLVGVSVEGWLTTAAGEVCALYRAGDAWVLFDEFVGDGDGEVNVTVTASTFDEMTDVVALVVELGAPPDLWTQRMHGAA